MAEITAALVKELREKTGAGMLDCKKALVEAQGNLDNAVDWLRKKGLAAAAKKAGRVASQGLVAALAEENKGVLLEVNSETDFVAMNDEFQKFVTDVLNVAMNKNGNIEEIKKAPLAGKTVEDTLTDLIAKIGENLNIRRAKAISVPEGVVVSYVHGAVSAGKGKIAVLIALESKADKNALQQLGKQIAMHVAAAAPNALNIEDVNPEDLEREKNILAEQARNSGKPENIIAKMLEGRLRKYYEEVVLLEQNYVVDPDKKVKDVIAEASKNLETPIKITGFIRYALGEGIEKKEENFAAEVAAQLKN